MNTREEIRLQVAISVIQGVLEAKHGVIGEVVPSVAVAIALRIADAFVEEWYRETKEQKPAVQKRTLKDEAERFLNVLSETPYNNTPIINAQVIVKELITFLESPERYNLNHISAEWSEEDERKIDDIIRIICTERECSKIANIGEEKEFDSSFYDRLVLFLKSLHPQPKQEWSEEDKAYLRNLTDYFECNDVLAYTTREVIAWLKSLRPQPHWKPSEEQMKALWEVEGRMRTNKAFTLSNRLASLYNDLKKL